MEFVVISGLSGAGKSSVANFLEDINFYCVDNMPVVLIPRFAEICMAAKSKYERVALVTDIRGGENFDELFKALGQLKEMGCDYKILFVESSTDAIIKRYQETRRRHPMESGQGIRNAIIRETAVLELVRNRADYIINTTDLKLRDLKEKVVELFVKDKRESTMIINVISFGFKFGIPTESDLIFDVRFLPNPYYIDNLRNLTGLDEPVRDFLNTWQNTGKFLQHVYELIDFLLPLYMEEGKASLVISIGCTGGRHRSVAIAKTLFERIKNMGYNAVLNHRDISRL